MEEEAARIAAARVDPQAFAPLYERYVGPIYRYCHLRLGDREAAEDATSEIFVKALASLGGYRNGSFPAWLFRIAHNVVVDQHRRRRPLAPLDAVGERPDPDPSRADPAIFSAERDVVRAALALLPEDQRAAVELGHAGWSGRQIGAALGKSPEAVKMLRFRAVSALRTILSDTGVADDIPKEAHRGRS
jgi:RNA polymerase sigma-70 factor (ECF subfamily)